MSVKEYSVAEIARLLDAEFYGDGKHLIGAIASLENAKANEMSFLNSQKYTSILNTTLAGCVLLSEEFKSSVKTNCIVVKDPYLAFAKVAQLLDNTPIPETGVHESACVAKSTQLGSKVSIAAGCVIENDCVIEDGVILGPNVVVGRGSKIGQQTRIFANVSIYHYVEIGRGCLIHAGAVIGSDGFGFANEKGKWVKIPQTGKVVIGDEVEVGANACIDRGALNNTIIGNGVKLDNFCHIAHNVELGANVAMAAYAGVAGSSKVGDYCTFSGRSTILGHLEIAPGTHVTACSLINKSNKEPGVFSSGTGMQDNKTWRKNVARFRQLDDMAKQIKELNKQLKKLQGDS
ncbi:UDP-3-O-(3-hydroxymyristoyl)glucosamine N-acyltransferase [Aliikangiella coralliicola]|uniref:UDP-3-O-acylglucosamine N-acyltransferase n=1 Tax=Aliikangiella coralliicola TaxID=2592383 RepID=A0A545UAZ9_9GAMM|nr:UDP-3-O-(3-hydroxymyristoyl)glucosamine N-acyltransferase [Aliikangiella coralliicola]TQV86635.1 UDP-3-O-(3-hydroxymyristoyl)glucosamine N-acyltransferase [Aliikangiella coralliicola]